MEEPRGWVALGATGCHSLREGMCCEERSSCDSQRAPSTEKVCDSQTHADTTVHNTHGHSDRHTTSSAQHSASRVSPRVPTSVHSRVSSFTAILPDHPPWVTLYSHWGCAAKNAAVVTVSAPRPLKKCVTVRHTQTQLCTTHTGTLTDTPQAVRSTARHVCLQECPRPCTAVSQVSPPSSPTILPGLRCTVTGDVLRRTQQL